MQNSRHREWDTIVQQVESEEEENCIQACCKVRSDSWGWRCIALFELEDRHALDFFSKRHGWSTEEKDLVARHPSTQCYACDHCRYEYAMYVVFSKDPLASLMDPDDLREAVSFAKGRTVKGGGTDRGGSFSGFMPSFYGVGAFNPILVKWWGRSAVQLCDTLQSQLTAERARYLVKHLGEESALRKNLSIFSPHKNDAYKNRFTYSTSLQIFLGGHIFPESNRAPVGLNPERFVEKCRSCNDYLIACEYGTEVCQRCKSSAVKNSETLQINCPICTKKKTNSLALGCGHVMCSDCVNEHATKSCPSCRKPVESRIVLYK